MHIGSISITNFMRIGDIDVALPKGVTLFAGLNEAGKSSLQEAIRLALFGDTLRVDKKGDYKLMVKDGAKSGIVSVTLDGIEFSRDVKTGELDDDSSPEPPDALRFALDAHRFSSLKPDSRRSFLFRALGVNLKQNTIVKTLLKRGANDEAVTHVKPLLATGGFKAACREAGEQAKDCRAEWKGKTGETYGSKKAEDWKAEKRFTEEDAAELSELKKALADNEAKIEKLIEKRGGEKRQHEGAQMNCPSCGDKLVYQMGQLHLYCEQGRDDPPDDAIDKELSTLKGGDRMLKEKIQDLEFIKRMDQQLDEVTDEAQEIHERAKSWKFLEDLLSPEGLPAEMISEAIDPVNDRMKQSSAATGWKLCQINPLMEITMDGRPYGLQSESSKWRADAMLAEAIAHQTGTNVLVLDRVDVLDVPSRAQLMKWLVKSESIDSALLFATLKEKPSLPQSINVCWMEKGAIA